MNPKYKSVVFCKNCKEISSECKDADNCACEKRHRVKAALKEAHEIRRFEIGLYWQRSLYFWGFQAAFFAAYALILGNSGAEDRCLVYAAIAAIAVLGMFVSFLWYYLAEGSKAWQENWENHIDQLENEITGRLYKTVLGKAKGFYSVTRINQLIIIVIGVGWIFLFSLPGIYLLKSFVTCTSSKESLCLIVIAFLALVLIVGIFLLIMALYRIKSSFPDDSVDNNRHRMNDEGDGIGAKQKINIYYRWKGEEEK